MVPGYYKINEIFYSIQGEGFYTGTPAVFIRLSGCNLKCPFCDTQHNEGQVLSIKQIMAQVDEVCAGERPHLVVLTGGEPTLWLDEDLCQALAKRFKDIAVESNGTRQPPKGITFLTISPKADFVSNAEMAVTTCDELKLVYTGGNDPGQWFEKIQADHYYLQPCDTGDTDKNTQIMALTLDYIKKHPWWRLSLQTQKIINVR